MKLPEFMAKACHYAQEHIDDKDAWDTSHEERTRVLQCTSYQMACFFSKNTVHGGEGVEWEIVIKELIKHPMKTEKAWLKIINDKAKQLGGWKKGIA
jgi:hypothetical protein